MTVAKIFLPMPPSTNNLYAHRLTKAKYTGKLVARRYPSRELQAWKTAAGKELNIQRPQRFDGPVTIEIEVQRMSRQRSADIDGRLKAAIDLLVAHQILKDDKYVVSVAGRWVPPGTHPYACLVTISEASQTG